MNYNTIIRGILTLSVVACVQAVPLDWQTTHIEGHDCHNRRVDVLKELRTYERIISEPQYLPRCEKNGVYWKKAQCDHIGQGGCFCVYREDGFPQANTEVHHQAILEEMKCGAVTYSNENGETTCRNRQQEFKDKRDQWDINTDIPLPYFPECHKDGSYQALQRDDSKYFCVDTRTGDKIPDTEIEAGSTPPLTEGLCQSYSEVWNQFRKWKSTLNDNGLAIGETTARNQKSCKKGFVFKACACPKICTPGAKAQVGKCDNCKPACVCPQNRYMLNGKCISLEKCHTLKPASKVLHANKLDSLTNGLWRQYQEENPNAVNDAHAKKLEEDEDAIVAGIHPVLPQGVVRDFVSSFNPSPMEEGIVEEMPEEYVGHLGPLGAEVVSRGNHNEGSPEEPTQERIQYGEHGQESTQRIIYPTPVTPDEESYEKPTGYDTLFNPDVDPEYEYNDGKYAEYEEEEEEETYTYEEEENNGVFNYEEEEVEGSSEIEEEEEITEPIREEEMVEHQRPGYARQFPALPAVSEEEAAAIEQEFLEETPCDEELEEGLIDEELIPTESQIAETIYRVLEKNNIIKPEEAKELLANFENPNIILKKQAVSE